MIPKIALTYKWEKETLDYLKLPGVTLSFAQTITLDDQIKIIKGGGTITLLAQSVNISKINGLAFLTNPSTDMRKFKGFKLSVKAAGKTLVGWVKAVGTGETLGSEVLSNYDFSGTWGDNDVPQGWTLAGTVDASNYLTADDANDRLTITTNGNTAMGISQSDILTLGKLYKAAVDINSVVTGRIKAQVGGSVAELIYLSSPGVTTAYRTYRVSSENIVFANRVPLEVGNVTLNNFSLKPVLTPSALGCTIASTIEGAEQSWTSDDGINPNSLTFDIDITNS